MKIRDVIKKGSVVETLVTLSNASTLSLPTGTVGRVTGEVEDKGKRYWEVSFPLPQADVYSVMLYSKEHPDMQIFYQTHELRKVRGKEPRPLKLVVARFIDARERYALYEITRDERLHNIRSVVELGTMSFADLPIQEIIACELVEPFCTERGWHLFYKEGEQPYRYRAELAHHAEEEDIEEGEDTLEMPTSGTVLAVTTAEARERAIRRLLRDYPPEEHYSGHERVQIEKKEY